VQVDESVALNIASLRRRLLAGLIDLAVFLPVGAGAAVAVYKLLRSSARPSLPFARHWRAATDAAGLPIAVAFRNSPSPGARALGLQYVDARSGGPVSVRGAVVRYLVALAGRKLMVALAGRRPISRSVGPRHESLDRGGPITESTDTRGSRSCTTALLVWIAIELPTLRSPLDQSLAEKVPGIAVIHVEG
jgi:uncharacterized RDD family membrane protein YckC